MNIREEYIQYYSQTYCSYEASMLLRQLGFDDICDNMYGLGIFHNGEYLDFDEECELKSEGRENEIEYVPGGWVYGHMYTRNSDDYCQTEGSCSMPRYDQALDFLLNRYGIHVFVMFDKRDSSKWHWCVEDSNSCNLFQQSFEKYDNNRLALDAGIIEVAKSIIKTDNEDKHDTDE